MPLELQGAYRHSAQNCSQGGLLHSERDNGTHALSNALAPLSEDPCSLTTAAKTVFHEDVSCPLCNVHQVHKDILKGHRGITRTTCKEQQAMLKSSTAQARQCRVPCNDPFRICTACFPSLLPLPFPVSNFRQKNKKKKKEFSLKLQFLKSEHLGQIPIQRATAAQALHGSCAGSTS